MGAMLTTINVVSNVLILQQGSSSIDPHTLYNNGVFTIKIAGNYKIDILLYCVSSGIPDEFSLYINNNPITIGNTSSGTDPGITFSIIKNLKVNDKLSIKTNNNTVTNYRGKFSMTLTQQ